MLRLTEKARPSNRPTGKADADPIRFDDHQPRQQPPVNPPAPAPLKSRRPDWLLILMIGLFLLALLIVWLVDIPALLD
ncbi:hypothetical protein GGR92_005114 [Spirosoma lacussanchae]|uniref:hypothetical protein n=1 Tax=Spirosoma lacussanchae TaxID=1884249 RepID=UPI001108425B|nr:hypothetical protein [Spirosoma lacussanchae]